MDSPEQIFAEIANRRVLVIGDTIVDVNTYCEQANDLDDGTPVYRKVLDDRGYGDRFSLGGAALVVRNLLELGAKVDFLTGIGYGAGHQQAANIHHSHLSLHALQAPKVQTLKSRIWCNGEKVCQVDQVDNSELPPPEQSWLRDTFEAIMGRRENAPEVIVIADYRHGLISEGLAGYFVERTIHQPPVLVSSQVSQSGSNHDWYLGASVFVLNRTEAQAVLPQMDQYDSDYVMELREKLQAPTVIVTCGAEGCLSADDLVGGARTLSPLPVRAVDPCGAGDAFVAAYAVTGMLSFANLWAGLSCTVPGANPPKKEMLKPYARGIERDVLGKDRDGTGVSGGDEAHHDAGRDSLFS